jgi:hypothetical protein
MVAFLYNKSLTERRQKGRKKMVFKVLDYRKDKDGKKVLEEWNFFDNVVNASNYFDYGTGMPVVRCCFRDGNIVTFSIPYVAYLMSDVGKTIEKFTGNCESEGYSDDVHCDTLQDAVIKATE